MPLYTQCHILCMLWICKPFHQIITDWKSQMHFLNFGWLVQTITPQVFTRWNPINQLVDINIYTSIHTLNKATCSGRSGKMQKERWIYVSLENIQTSRLSPQMWCWCRACSLWTRFEPSDCFTFRVFSCNLHSWDFWDLWGRKSLITGRITLKVTKIIWPKVNIFHLESWVCVVFTDYSICSLGCHLTNFFQSCCM